MEGSIAGFGSESEADMRLACILCWWTGSDLQVESITRSSALARDKWKRPDYIRRTIEAARRKVG
jgi:primase-polymerase (primpol)-like protein